MHSLQVIKNVASVALDDEDPAGRDTFHAVVDPGSVLEMAAIIETLLEHVEQAGTNPKLIGEVQLRLCGGFSIPRPSEE